MKVKDRLFKTFYSKFEYKILRDETEDKKTEISWEEFQAEMLGNFSNSEKNYKSYILLETFKKYFEYHNNSLRLFKIYMIYFPLVLNLEETNGLSFIELIFEKILYNLEVEMYGNNKGYKIGNAENILTDETRTDRSVTISHINLADKSTNRKLLETFIEKRKKNSENIKKDDSQKEVNSIDHKLLSSFWTVFHQKNAKKNFIKKIPIEIFKEIMIVYFHTNITFFLKAFKDCIKQFNPKKHDKKLRGSIRKFNYQLINYDDLTDENVEQFIKHTIFNLIEKRDQLKPMEYDKILLTYDDIYVYYKINPHFSNSIKTYQEFLIFMANK